MARPQSSDEVLEALDDLLVVLRETSQRSQVEARRAQTMRRLRSHGRSYREILRRVKGASNQGIAVENVDRLLQANDRLQGAETRALYGEGVGEEEIAALLGMRHQRVSTLLPNEARQDEATG